MPCPLKGPRPLPRLQVGRPEHPSAKQLLCPSWLGVGAFLPVHTPGDSRFPGRARRACGILVQRERKGGWQPCAVWGAAAQSGLGSEACMVPFLFCPWTTSQAPGGPPRNHAHWELLLKRLREGTCWLPTLLPGICPSIYRDRTWPAGDLAGSPPGKHRALALHP